jgi:hypothetical protein
MKRVATPAAKISLNRGLAGDSNFLRIKKF